MNSLVFEVKTEKLLENELSWIDDPENFDELFEGNKLSFDDWGCVCF